MLSRGENGVIRQVCVGQIIFVRSEYSIPTKLVPFSLLQTGLAGSCQKLSILRPF